jgi:hypothetical protein
MPEEMGSGHNYPVALNIIPFESQQRPNVFGAKATSPPSSIVSITSDFFFIIAHYSLIDFREFVLIIRNETSVLLPWTCRVCVGVTGTFYDWKKFIQAINFLKAHYVCCGRQNFVINHVFPLSCLQTVTCGKEFTT